MGRSVRACSLVAVVCLFAAEARAQGGDDGGEPPVGDEGAPPAGLQQDESEGETASGASSGSGSEWRWKQVLAHTRIGGRMTAVSVDPSNPRRIFVGTEEGTILRSTDGGVTWMEFELRPFVVQDRNVRPRSPGLPKLGKQTRIGLTFFLDPPFRYPPPDRVTMFFDTLFFSIKPDFMSIGFTPKVTPLSQTFLADVVTSRRNWTIPVRRIAVCPGGSFPLMVATRREVLGSMDDGRTWVRLFRLPGRHTAVNWLECSPFNSNNLMVASSFGMFYSTDGGNTFEQDLSSRPGIAATTVAFGPPRGDELRMYVAYGASIWVGDPRNDEGLERVYPDFNNSATAPWRTIRWIEPAGDGTVWIATDDGVRLSRDEGENWEPAGSLFDRHYVFQVLSGPAEGGGQRIAALTRDCPVKPRPGKRLWCRKSYIYATDDGGRSWFPFFQGLSRRSFHQMASAPSAEGEPPRWWLLTSGELWATVGPEADDALVVDRESARWARQKLRDTPPMSAVIDAMLDNNDLSPGAVKDTIDSAKARNLLPIVNAELRYGDLSRRSAIDRGPPTPVGNLFDSDSHISRRGLYIFVQATWTLKHTAFVTEELGNTRRQLHELRRQISFIAEDAYHERRMHLRRIARGMSDPFQIAVLKERVASLDTVLEIWTGRPLEEVGPQRQQQEE